MNDHRARSVLVGLALLVAPLTATAEDGSFIRDGIELHYRTSGSGAPAILLSGGPGFNVDYMAGIAEFLPDRYERVFYEQRGTGRSLVPNMTAASMTLRHVVDDLEALRVHLKQERLLLIGHSWGGMLAMAYASAFPQRVDRLILIGSGGPTLEFVTWFTDNIHARLRPEDLEAEAYWDAAVKKGVDPDKAALEAFNAITPGYFFDRAKALAFVAAMPEGSLHVRVNEWLFEDLRKSYDLREALQKLDRPVLIVQGHQDPIGQKTAEEIHALVRSSTLRYISRSGHLPWIEQPEDFRRVLEPFLRDAASAR